MSGSVQQIEYVVNQHVIPPLWFVKIFFVIVFFYREFFIISSNLLQQQDVQLLQVCLDALHNILKQTSENNLERITIEIEECGGRNK